MQRIILASSSPRRKDLLELLKLPFDIIVREVDESFEVNLTPSQNVERLAFHKAFAVSQEFDKGIVIGADTVVVKDELILGKPKSRTHAAKMLKFLSGSIHQVWTGVAVIDTANGRQEVFSEMTEVTVKALDEKEIDSYISTGEPMGKAGSYAVQGIGSVFVKRINGCYFNVVGLPVYRLAEVLKKFSVRVF